MLSRDSAASRRPGNTASRRKWHAAAALAAVMLTASHQALAQDYTAGSIPQLLLFIALGVISLVCVGLLLYSRGLRSQLRERCAALAEERARRESSEQRLRQSQDQMEQHLLERSTELEQTSQKLDAARRKLEATESRVDALTRIDMLTGVANRMDFDDSLDQELKRALRAREPLSLLLCSIDHFEAYNESAGHAKGDAALKAIAAAIESTSKRAGDLVARFDGSTFGMILPSADQKAAVRLAERVGREVWSLCIPHDNSTVADRITVSSGVVTVEPNRIHSVSDVIAAARSALVDAKDKGRNRVHGAQLAA